MKLNLMVSGVWVVIFKMFKIIDTILINQIIMYTILIVWNPRGCHNTDHKRLNSKQTDMHICGDKDCINAHPLGLENNDLG